MKHKKWMSVLGFAVLLESPMITFRAGFVVLSGNMLCEF